MQTFSVHDGSFLTTNDRRRIGILHADPALPAGISVYQIGPGYVEKQVLRIQEDETWTVSEKLRRFAQFCLYVAQCIDAGSCFMPDECVENLGVYVVRP